jgi:signal transduction histidine kinase
VRDTGRGIPADKLDKIFDRLYQVKSGEVATEQGVGLGLYICRELVLLHGGEIRVASEMDQGSTFTFSIPKIRAASRGGLATPGLESARFQGGSHVALSNLQP